MFPYRISRNCKIVWHVCAAFRREVTLTCLRNGSKWTKILSHSHQHTTVHPWIDLLSSSTLIRRLTLEFKRITYSPSIVSISFSPLAGVIRNLSGDQEWSVLDKSPAASRRVRSSPTQNVSQAAYKQMENVFTFYLNISIPVLVNQWRNRPCLIPGRGDFLFRKCQWDLSVLYFSWLLKELICDFIFIVHSLSLASSHRPEVTEILWKMALDALSYPYILSSIRSMKHLKTHL